MPDIGFVSELEVMRSAAGYYVGTYYTHTGGECKGLVEPNSRDSHYMETSDEAEDFLKFMKGE